MRLKLSEEQTYRAFSIYMYVSYPSEVQNSSFYCLLDFPAPNFSISKQGTEKDGTTSDHNPSHSHGVHVTRLEETASRSPYQPYWDFLLLLYQSQPTLR